MCVETLPQLLHGGYIERSFMFIFKISIFKKVVIAFLKKINLGISNVICFKGCVGQYKNCNNFTSLYHHKDDFGLNIEWHFLATSHGKNVCDKIGGTANQNAALANLQPTIYVQILTSLQLFEFCEQHISRTKYFYVYDETDSHKKLLEKTFSSAKTIPGTCDNHCFIPINKTAIKSLESPLWMTCLLLNPHNMCCPWFWWKTWKLVRMLQKSMRSSGM